MSLCVGFDETEFKPIIIEAFEGVDYVKANLAYNDETKLKEIVEFAKKKGIKTILDCKIGDIKRSQEAYLEKYKDFDYLTINPYMGFDVFIPFVKVRMGCFVLVLTSNDSRDDFQMLEDRNGVPLYMKVAEKVVEWNMKYCQVGVVIGATVGNREFNNLIRFFYSKLGRLPPILVPGIGSQGGRCVAIINNVVRALNAEGVTNKFDVKKELQKVILSNSSAIMKDENPLRKIKEMRKEIDKSY